VVFETTLDDLPAFGSIGSGGRYNDLASRFTSRELPGVGGSVGLDRLVAAYEELNLLSTAKTQTAPLTFVAVATEDATPYAFDIVGRLRAAGLPADIGMTPKLGNQFKHADRLGAIAVITVGTSEMQTRTCAIKVLGTGQETKGVPVASVVQSIQKLHM
jgi:histidyl-tRNA synthetase